MVEIERCRFTLNGLVQGVGMRPFIYRLAHELGLSGWVRNAPDGVLIEVQGPTALIEQFRARLSSEKPVPARIDRCRSAAVPVDTGSADFLVIDSANEGLALSASLPDLASCPACLAELFDPADRRYRYPFVSCSECGPRYSIVESLPFDRERTAMRLFPLCPLCLQEYRNPQDRRFHAQTLSCPVCGPQLSLWSGRGEAPAAADEALRLAVRRLRQGEIVAVKGIGGFQLLANAQNEDAVLRLRLRKHRPAKPFALMMRDLEMARRYCDVSAAEIALLGSSAAPIVLCRRREHAGLAASIAPASGRLGLMLAYSPLHHLLLADFGAPVVATSGNAGGEPICVDEYDALRRLGAIADCLLVHNRPVQRPLDDSVMRVAAGKPLMLRRARGFAPMALELPGCLPPILATGGHLKNTVALALGSQAILSQHLGDLDTTACLTLHRDTQAELGALYRVQPQAVAVDSHPDYAGGRIAEQGALPIIRVDHHYAHALACIAEHGLQAPVLAVVWDGIGLGADGGLWGGEFLRIEAAGYRRIASLWPLRLPGGERAIREPRRAALSVLHELGLETATITDAFEVSELATLTAMLHKGFKSPSTSSAGRLFDALAGLLGVCQINEFEGQAAMALESLAEQADEADALLYPCELLMDASLPRVDWRPLFRALLNDARRGVSPPQLAYRFHASLADAILRAVQQQDIATVVLSGGCFQNRLLLELSNARLQQAGFKVYWPQQIPPNDGGLALGQLAAALINFKQENLRCV
ncbi:carbamoyltransferase HypF [Candidatus Methylospira mobilis]|uniref:Carbamoyltransferase HypF n=1 Tax=Candidatus Methylospira mobilis TaxID=1808979 RepID=A0A5Q0BRC7_9GAMM|nr:carbamoyltransferase HypF [Candidatus Methylospira mobilis]QFY44851.1 carbamoyltransferase HypF [Candidatus Methylospira mobilis]WNV05605.1 carbamoyltransferase HypF [Candidatus Methylospira mobilis]